MDNQNQNPVPQPQPQVVNANNIPSNVTGDTVVLTSPAMLMNISLHDMLPKPINVTLYKTHLKVEYTDLTGSNPDTNKTIADIPITEIQEVKTPPFYQQRAAWSLNIKSAGEHYKIAWRGDTPTTLSAAFGGFTPPNGLSVKDWNKLWISTTKDLKSGVT